jgi:hypothetical protein
MAFAAPILAGGAAKLAGLVGAGAAGLGALLTTLRGLSPVMPTHYIDLTDVAPVGAPGAGGRSAGATTVNNARRIINRLRHVATRLRPFASEVLRDMAKETIEKAVTTPFAVAALTDALGYWLAADLRARASFHKDLHIPTRETFTKAIDDVADTIAALMVVDVVSGRDVGSDLAESIIDAFSESVLGDVIKSYLDTVSGVKAVDDDEIRDIVGEGAAETPEELAYLGARSGLDTYSAMAELYTGLLQGDNPYFARIAREVDDVFKRWERGLAPVYVIGNVLERIGGDVADGVYWYLGALSRVENQIESLVKEAVDLYVLYLRGAITEDRLSQFYSNMMHEIDAIEAALDAFDDGFVDFYASQIADAFTDFASHVPYGMLYRLVEDLMMDAGMRIKEYVEATAEAYRRLKDIRSVSVAAQ